jgi:hypothetical protein
MQVFRLNNAKTEPVAAEKFKTWWFFISKLGSKAVIIFDQVTFFLFYTVLFFYFCKKFKYFGFFCQICKLGLILEKFI